MSDQSNEVFTLYEMAKEISKNFNERDAFDVFQKGLQQNVTCEECLLLDPWSKELDELKAQDDFFLFPLKGKREILGYLALKGVDLDDKEKIMILKKDLLNSSYGYQELFPFSGNTNYLGLKRRRGKILECFCRMETVIDELFVVMLGGFEDVKKQSITRNLLRKTSLADKIVVLRNERIITDPQNAF